MSKQAKNLTVRQLNKRPECAGKPIKWPNGKEASPGVWVSTVYKAYQKLFEPEA